MEIIYYKDLEEFENSIKFYKKIDCNEGIIYFTINYVYKILTREKAYCSPRLIKPISKLNSTFLTVPKFLIYLFNKYDEKFNKCTGFAMENGGSDLWSLLLNDSLSFEKKKEIAFQMKEICSYLKKKRYVHGDIKLENFLYKDGALRLTDVNNMRSNLKIRRDVDKLRMPQFYEIWYLKCEDGFYVDYLATNFCIYILLNFDSKEIKKIESKDTYGFSYDCYMALDSENKVFDDAIIDKMKTTFEHIEERKLTKEFIVDYLK